MEKLKNLKDVEGAIALQLAHRNLSANVIKLVIEGRTPLYDDLRDKTFQVFPDWYREEGDKVSERCKGIALEEIALAENNIVSRVGEEVSGFMVKIEQKINGYGYEL